MDTDKIKTLLTLVLFGSSLICLYIRRDSGATVPRHLLYLMTNQSLDVEGSPPRLEGLQERLVRRNVRRRVLNEGRFGPVSAEAPVLAVAARADLQRLQYLVVSLAQVRHIDSVLLVFSHAYYHEAIDDLIKRIDFCMVMQIFYPNSVQLYPDSFPGTDKEDCTNSRGEWCVQRDGRLAEEKHHWWWTAHHLFEEVPRLRAHKGFVMFLSESSYVLPDLLHVMRYGHRSLSTFNQVEVLSFGRSLARGLPYDDLIVDEWKPLYDNGVAFNRSTWGKISALAVVFCNYNDVSWSYSLLKVLSKWGRRRALTVCSAAPRVVKTGAYGSGGAAHAALGGLARHAGLFPDTVRVVALYGRAGMVFSEYRVPPDGNGGWEDARDRALCMAPAALQERNGTRLTLADYITTETN